MTGYARTFRLSAGTFLLLLVMPPLSRAQNSNNGYDANANSAVSPSAMGAAAPYFADPGFNGGFYKVDFTEKFSAAVGRKIARLSNGDVIVAGVTSAFLGVASPPYNLGLVRYNSSGQRVAWTNPGSFGFINNNYVIYPNSNDPNNALAVKEVVDIKVVEDRLFVLVDHRIPSSGDINSSIYVFRTDGSILRSQVVLGSSFSEYSGAMIISESNTVPPITSIVVTASTFNGVWRPTLIRGIINADSSITFGAPTFPNPGNYCPTNRGCILRDIARSERTDGSGPTFYLAGTRQSNIPDNGAWDFLVMKISAIGLPVTSFGGSGVTTVAFDDGPTKYDDANSIAVKTNGIGLAQHDQIYVSGFVNRVCNDGVGVAKLKDDGSLDTSFGISVTGKLIVGGGSPSAGVTCAQLPPPAILATYGTGIALSGDKLAIAGYTTMSPGGESDSRVAVIDTVTGNIDSFQPYVFNSTVSGARLGQSAFWGIAESGNGTFTMSGTVQQTGSVQQYGTLRVRGDRIFANGFE